MDGEDIPSVNFSEKTFNHPRSVSVLSFYPNQMARNYGLYSNLGLRHSDYWNEDYDLIQDDDWDAQSCLESIGDFLNNDDQRSTKY